MKSSQSPSMTRCKDTRYCYKEHQTDRWKFHKKICVAPMKKVSAPVPHQPPIPLKGSIDEEEDYDDMCVVCFDNVPDAQMRPCGHSMICRNCTQELMSRSQPCPICRKPISSFEVGVYSNGTGEPGLWPMSYKHFGQLASGEGFNEYFRKKFNGNEEPYLEWKEVFDVLEIVGGMGCHHNVRVQLETQVLSIMRSEDLVKLRALATLSAIFADSSLHVALQRRIFEVLELAMLEEKKV